MRKKGYSLIGTWIAVLAIGLWSVPAHGAAMAGGLAPDPQPLAEVLEELGRRYGVFFTYDAQLIAGTEVSFELRPEEELEVAIDRLLTGTGFGYEVFDEKYFVLYRDTERGRREASRLRRKIRQLGRLEDRGDTRLGRTDTDAARHFGQVRDSLAELRSDRAITGRVTSEKGEPLVGVAILVQGTSRGTVTDARGYFTLQPDWEYAELRFSYVGYQAQRLRAASGQELTVRLRSAETELPEVLIVGYGSVDPSAATASIGQVEGATLQTSRAVTAPNELLLGQVAGVQVLASNGEPGAFQSIRIRGGSSMNAGNEPLYVIDGMPVVNDPHTPEGLQPGRNPLNALNPADIERISILKDAAASAIYGSRAANGVVLIETKKSYPGAAGRLSYDAWFSVAQPGENLDVYEAAAYRELVAEQAPNRLAELGSATTNWQAAIFHAALSQQHTLSYAQGNAGSGYRISLGYLGQESVVKGASTERTSATLYLQQQLLDRQLQLEGNLNLARLRDAYVSPDILEYAYSFDPTQPIYDPTSPWGGYFEYENDILLKNPIAVAELVADESRQFRFMGHLRANYKPTFLPGLTATLHLSNDYTDGTRNRFAPATLRAQFADRGEFRLAGLQQDNRLWESYLTYRTPAAADRPRLTLTGGYTYQHFRGDFPEQVFLGIQSTRYDFGRVPVSDRQVSRESYRENRLASFFLRGNVEWRDRYYLTASFRTDGSSRFSPDHRWATFPAASVAWRLTEERFLRNRPTWLSALKLRAGWGVTGNQEIGDYEYLPTFTYGDSRVRYPFGDQFIVTARPNAVSTDLKWEQTVSSNLALDAEFFAGRLRATLEAYRSTTRDLLSRVVVPAGSNLSNVVLVNVGSLRNRGLEFTAAAELVQRPELQWDLSFNLATNRNRILSLGPTPELNFRAVSTGGINGGIGNTIQIFQVGQPLHAFYVFRHRYDDKGQPLVDGIDHNGDGQIDLADMYQDTNADGVVNDRDKTAWQQPAPTWFGGLQSRLRYRNWGLRIALRVETGNYVYNNIAALSEALDRVRSQPILLNLPGGGERVRFQSQQLFSDYYVEDASFLRVDALTFDHTFSSHRSERRLRLYGTVQNVLTWTAYRGLDPEIGNVSGNPRDPRFGIDDRVFPRARTFLVGVDMTL